MRAEPAEAVIVVHGLWVHGVIMEYLRRRIARCGYRAVSYSYPTMRLALDENAERLARFSRGVDAARRHFVGHSLGAIVILRLLERAPDLCTGRIVLLGPPFAGSFSGRRLERLPGGGWLLGRSVREWLARPKSAPSPLQEIGVIAGSLPLGLGYLVAPDLPRPNDGVVTVEETRVPGMRDHIVVRVNHSGMLFSPEVARHVCDFLRCGAFSKRRGS